MPRDHLVLCGDVSPLAARADRILRLRMWPPEQNVHLKYEGLRSVLWRDVPPTFLDLIDVATYVYCADQAFPRGGPTDPGLGKFWRRRLRFRLPVRRPDLWTDPKVLGPLVDTLSFLSDDEYRFDFEPLRTEPPAQGYFDLTDEPAPVPDSVILFSGGLDSLAGAVQESVVEGRNVLLVSHRPTTKLAVRLRALLDGLKTHAKRSAPLHLPDSINKSEYLNHEYTQRSRSFLYAALGAAVAVMLGLERIRFYENGVVSLNLPPAAQVVDARATRTTHPRVLRGFAQLFSRLADRPFVVENRFQWLTKAEAVQVVERAGCADLLGLTTSCTRTWEMTRDRPHCGRCSQCIDRRFGVLAAGQEAADPGEAYDIDLLTGAREEGTTRTMLASYLETTTRVESMGPVEFSGSCGEPVCALPSAENNPEPATIRV